MAWFDDLLRSAERTAIEQFATETGATIMPHLSGALGALVGDLSGNRFVDAAANNIDRLRPAADAIRGLLPSSFWTMSERTGYAVLGSFVASGIDLATRQFGVNITQQNRERAIGLIVGLITGGGRSLTTPNEARRFARAVDRAVRSGNSDNMMEVAMSGFSQGGQNAATTNNATNANPTTPVVVPTTVPVWVDPHNVAHMLRADGTCPCVQAAQAVAEARRNHDQETRAQAVAYNGRDRQDYLRARRQELDRIVVGTTYGGYGASFGSYDEAVRYCGRDISCLVCDPEAEERRLRERATLMRGLSAPAKNWYLRLEDEIVRRMKHYFMYQANPRLPKAQAEAQAEAWRFAGTEMAVALASTATKARNGRRDDRGRDLLEEIKSTPVEVFAEFTLRFYRALNPTTAELPAEPYQKGLNILDALGEAKLEVVNAALENFDEIKTILSQFIDLPTRETAGSWWKKTRNIALIVLGVVAVLIGLLILFWVAPYEIIPEFICVIGAGVMTGLITVIMLGLAQFEKVWQRIGNMLPEKFRGPDGGPKMSMAHEIINMALVGTFIITGLGTVVVHATGYERVAIILFALGVVGATSMAKRLGFVDRANAWSLSQAAKVKAVASAGITLILIASAIGFHPEISFEWKPVKAYETATIVETDADPNTAMVPDQVIPLAKGRVVRVMDATGTMADGFRMKKNGRGMGTLVLDEVAGVPVIPGYAVRVAGSQGEKQWFEARPTMKGLIRFPFEPPTYSGATDKELAKRLARPDGWRQNSRSLDDWLKGPTPFWLRSLLGLVMLAMLIYALIFIFKRTLATGIRKFAMWVAVFLLIGIAAWVFWPRGDDPADGPFPTSAPTKVAEGTTGVSGPAHKRSNGPTFPAKGTRRGQLSSKAKVAKRDSVCNDPATAPSLRKILKCK